MAIANFYVRFGMLLSVAHAGGNLSQSSIETSIFSLSLSRAGQHVEAFRNDVFGANAAIDDF